MNPPPLKLYSHIIPAAQIALATQDWNIDYYTELNARLSEATVFDCRELPMGFLEDTGAAAKTDLLETAENRNLPYDVCYFEFPHDLCALVWEQHNDEY